MKLRVLVSYASWNARMADALRNAAAAVPFEWILDSGAFTAHNTGRPIALKDYATFVQRLLGDATMPPPTRYMTLDVIGDAKRSRDQFDALRALGLSPEPVFTRGAPIEDLDYYAERADIVSFGGIAKGGAKNFPWLKWAFETRPGMNRRAHVLGIGGAKMLRWFQPYSCDCTTWSNPRRYHQLVVYDGLSVHQIVYRDKVIAKFRDGSWAHIASAIRSLGYDPAELTRHEVWSTSASDGLLTRIAIASWLRLASEAWARIESRVNLVATSPSDLDLLVACYRRMFK